MSVPRNDAPAHSRKVRDGEPLRRIQTYRIKPAAKNRIAASRNGGTSRTPTRIARKVGGRFSFLAHQGLFRFSGCSCESDLSDENFLWTAQVSFIAVWVCEHRYSSAFL